MMRIPPSAKRIADARLAGQRPADMVIVSLIGDVGEGNPTIYVKQGGYDWWFLKDLDVCVYAMVGSKWKEVVEEICKAKPRQIWLWDVENHEGADVYYLPTLESVEWPQNRWRWIADVLPWCGLENRSFSNWR